MSTNFLPLRVYKKIDILTKCLKFHRVNDEISDNAYVNMIHDQMYVMEEYEPDDQTLSNKRIFLLILASNSKYEQGDKASKYLEKLIKSIPVHDTEELCDVIFITEQKFDKYRANIIKKFNREGLKFKNIQYYQIFANPLNYSRSTKMRVITKEEEEQLLEWLGRPKDYLPKMISEDICSIYLDLVDGDIVEIIRDDDCGDNISYRVFVDTS